MKLVYPEWERAVTFVENRIPVVVIENPRYFRRISWELYCQIKGGGGRFVLSDSDKEIELNKWAEIILSPFAVNTGDTRFGKKLYKQLEDIANEEELQETGQINSHIFEYLYGLMDYLGYDLTCDEEVDLQVLFKAAGVKPVFDNSDSLHEMVDYIDLLSSLLNMRLIVMLNYRMFLEVEELKLFYNTVSQKKLSVLLLENSMKNEKIECEDVLTIDSDLCEI